MKTLSLIMCTFLIWNVAQAGNFVMVMMLLNSPTYKGFAITKAGDTITGQFTTLSSQGITIQRKNEKGSKGDSLLKTENLRSVFFKQDSSDTNYVQVDYLPQYKRWYRKVYAGKRIYYGWNGLMGDKPDVLQGDPIICTPKGECMELKGKKEARKILIDYINRTFQTSYAYRDLPTSMDAIRALESKL